MADPNPRLLLDPDIGRFLWSIGFGGMLGILAIAGYLQADAFTSTQENDRLPSLPYISRQLTNASTKVPMEHTLGLLHTFNRRKLTDPQWRHWLHCAAATYARNLGEPGTPVFRERVRLADRYYRAALGGEQLPRRYNSLLHQLARLHKDAGNWQKAVDLFEQINMDWIAESQQAGIHIDWGNCLVRLAETPRALAVLEQAVTGGDWEQRQQALLAKLRILLAQLSSHQSGTPEFEATLVLADATYAALDTDAMLELVIRRQLDLAACHLSVAHDDYDRLVEQVRAIQVSGVNAEVKLESLRILAAAIVRAKRWRDARIVVDAVLDRFRGNKRAGEIVALLMPHCLATWDPADSVDICRRAVLRFSDPQLATILIEAMLDENNGFLGRIDELRAFGDADIQVNQILLAIANQYGGNWDQTRQLVWLLRSRLAAVQGRWSDAGEHLTHYLRQRAGLPTPPAASFLDLLTGANDQLGPAAMAVRARRFIYHFPDHEQAPIAIHRLIAAYHEMALYESSMTVAQSAFLRTIWDIGESQGVVADARWLQTIAAILRGYVKLGDYDKADLLFKMYGPYLLRMDNAPDVIADCARGARALNQSYEAVRRYDLAIERATGVLTFHLKTERAVCALEADFPMALDDARLLLKALRQQEEPLPEPLLYLLEKQIHEAILKYIFEHDRDAMRAELSAVPDSFGGETWMSAWVLRVMSMELKDRDLETWRAEHAEIINAGVAGIVTDTRTHEFLQQQVELIDGLIALEKRMTDINQRGMQP